MAPVLVQNRALWGHVPSILGRPLRAGICSLLYARRAVSKACVNGASSKHCIDPTGCTQKRCLGRITRHPSPTASVVTLLGRPTQQSQDETRFHALYAVFAAVHHGMSAPVFASTCVCKGSSQRLSRNLRCPRSRRRMSGSDGRCNMPNRVWRHHAPRCFTAATQTSCRRAGLLGVPNGVRLTWSAAT